MVDHLFSDLDLAAVYDAFCPREQRDDFQFYLPLVMGARSVLDVGCGTGALLHWARERGHTGRLCGLDPAPGMLEQARKRADIEWILGDLSSRAWETEFELVVMTGHAFQVLLEDKALLSALTTIRAALAEGGRFAFETRNPLVRAWEHWTSDPAEEVVDSTGIAVRMQREVEGEVRGDLVCFSHTFTSAHWERPQVSRSTLRFLDAPSLSSFLTRAGLSIEAQFGDWDRTPLTETSPEIITLAVRA